MIHKDQEIVAEEGRDVSELLATLPRVEAPANFEFGVKARIASAGTRRSSPLFRMLKVAVPLSILILVGLTVLYVALPDREQQFASRPDNSRTETNSSPVAPNPEPTSLKNQQDLVAKLDTPTPQMEPGTGAGAETPNRPSQSPLTSSGKKSRKQPQDGAPLTRDESVSTAPVINPPGIRPNGGDISVRDTLEMLGMNVEADRGGWKVISVSGNGLATKAGVMAGDVIEAINEQSIRGKEKIAGRLETKTVTVVRKGKSVKLELRN